MSLHYLVKHEWLKNQRNSPCSKKTTNHNILLSNILINVSVAYRCLLCNRTTSPDLFKQMFKMSPFGFHTSKKTLSPLAYGCIDDAHGRQLPRLQQCVHAVRRCCWWVADTCVPELRSKSYSLPDLNRGCSAATETEKWNRELPFPAAQQ